MLSENLFKIHFHVSTYFYIFTPVYTHFHINECMNEEIHTVSFLLNKCTTLKPQRCARTVMTISNICQRVGIRFGKVITFICKTRLKDDKCEYSLAPLTWLTFAILKTL